MDNEVPCTLHGRCRVRHFIVQWGNNAYVAVRHLVDVVRRRADAVVAKVCVAAASAAVLHTYSRASAHTHTQGPLSQEREF